MASEAEVAAMRRAIQLALKPVISPRPNPRVGAVVLDASGRRIGQGFHRGPGTPHAEVVALAAAGAAAAGGTVVVSLEPCKHLGRTGPCVSALLAAGVRRVVYAQRDPNPLAAGGGAALAAAGVDVEGEVLADEAAAANPAWTFAMLHRRPFVTWKFAATLDGRSAAADGSSQWITGPEARRDVAQRRAECDVVLVGTGTALADDPRLTVRDEDDLPAPRERQPLRVVMGYRVLPDDAALLDEAAPTLLLRTHDPVQALEQLFAGHERRHVWLEGGPTLAANFVRAGVVDEVVAYVAPAILGAGRSAVGDFGITRIADIVRLRLESVARVGDDVRLTMRRDLDSQVSTNQEGQA
ncbi:MAG: bifunctional diaminohydroxyphosphoribosylaminopyrimidine deaminase/5-amino-6-(5-phosphoribosylamino)uracil reductase RibD [Nocardioidaceae bacterium]